MKGRQLPLFDMSALPSRPFPRYSRKLDEVRICSRCGRQVVVRRTHDGLVTEFMSKGMCLNCHRTSR